MEIKATMKPGQNGTKRYMEKYGDRLLCVRYRYDKPKGKRALIISPPTPVTPPPASAQAA